MKKLYSLIGLIVFITLISLNTIISGSSSINNNFTSKLDYLKISNVSANEIECSCPWLFGKDCKADHWGKSCAPEGTTNCWEWDLNCGNQK